MPEPVTPFMHATAIADHSAVTHGSHLVSPRKLLPGCRFHASATCTTRKASAAVNGRTRAVKVPMWSVSANRVSSDADVGVEGWLRWLRWLWWRLWWGLEVPAISADCWRLALIRHSSEQMAPLLLLLLLLLLPPPPVLSPALLRPAALRPASLAVAAIANVTDGAGGTAGDTGGAGPDVGDVAN